MGPVVDPGAAHLRPLASGDAGGMTDDSDQVPLPPRLDAQHTEAAFLVVVRHAFDQTGQRFGGTGVSALRGRGRWHPIGRCEQLELMSVYSTASATGRRLPGLIIGPYFGRAQLTAAPVGSLQSDCLLCGSGPMFATVREGICQMRCVVSAAIVTVLLAMTMPVTHAEGPSCNATVTDKKLAGAARNSFLKKCEADAKAQCDSAAASKKLAGAAKTSFTKKCVTDAIGA